MALRYMQVVVLCGVPYSKQLEINDWTHENGVHFIAAETRGLFGCVDTSCYGSMVFIKDWIESSVFNDFGPKFTCVDPTGEQPLTGMIVSVDKVVILFILFCLSLISMSQDKEGLVTCLDETRHGLEDGDFVTFTEVQGMTGLNGCEPRKVSVKGPYTFTIGDTSYLEDYTAGGIFTQVKMPKIIDFVSR